MLPAYRDLRHVDTESLAFDRSMLTLTTGWLKSSQVGDDEHSALRAASSFHHLLIDGLETRSN